MRNQRLRELKVYKKRTRRRKYLRIKNFLSNRPKEKPKKGKKRLFGNKPRSSKVIRLPDNFSFIQNPEEVLKVFGLFENYALEGIDVLLDFRHVQNITPDIIPLLLAKVSKYKKLIRISGNRPLNKTTDDLLLESGFYKLVGVTSYISSNGLLEMHKSKIVDREVAVKARKLTSEKTFGDPDKWIKPLYRTLIECMANTNKHASDQEQVENWWLSVYHDPQTKTTSFSFCDTGVGIFRSTRLENITKFALKIGLKSNSDILQSILSGKIASSTGLPYRGKGLPKIYSDYQSKSLRKLYIIANDTFADFDNGSFVELKNELNGTFLYWEIKP